MVWLLILLVAALAFVALRFVAKLDWSAMQLVAAGLLMAVAGYAWLGHPSMAGKPGKAVIETEQVKVGGETFRVLRRRILGQFDQADSWLTMSDGFLSRGNSVDAVGILRAGIRQHPRDPDLWIGLGNALFLHAGVAMTPAAEYAFDRAQALAPNNPAPLFFRGMALAQGGQFVEAEAAWRQTLAMLPANASWRPLVEERLELVQQLRAMQEAQANMQVQGRAGE